MIERRALRRIKAELSEAIEDLQSLAFSPAVLRDVPVNLIILRLLAVLRLVEDACSP